MHFQAYFRQNSKNGLNLGGVVITGVLYCWEEALVKTMDA